MPIYEYQCSKCGHHLEVIQKMSDTPLTECPECHQSALAKLISAAGFQLKGSGWYLTDYSSKGKEKKHVPESSSRGHVPESSSRGSESKSSESKDSSSTDKSSDKSSTDSGATS